MNGDFLVYICPNGHSFKVEYTAWIQTTPCQKCEKRARMAELVNPMDDLSIGVKKYAREPVAFYRDPVTGKEIASDGKGRLMDPSDTRYNLNRDPRGWRATGKKVRSKDKAGREQ